MSTTQSIVVRGATLVNPDGLTQADVLITDGLISDIGTDFTADIEIDAAGCYISSGFVDLHTHLREPGKEEAETKRKLAGSRNNSNTINSGKDW